MRDILQNSKAKLIILVLVFVFGFTAPFYISSGAGAIAYISKEFGLDLIARIISRKLLSDLSNGMIEKINNLGSERPGETKPAFVQNWKTYLGEAQTVGENQFRAQLTYTIQKEILCSDLKGPLAKAFQVGNNNAPYIDIGTQSKYAQLKQNTLVPYQTKVRCTVPDKTRAEFKKDFAKGGGWDTWNRMLEPQNNLAGALSLSLEEMEIQRSSQEEAQKNEAVAGQGFQGVKGACQQATSAQAGDTVCFKKCFEEGIKIRKLTVEAVTASCTNQCKGETALGANAKCSFMGNTVTPAKIMGEGAANFIDANSRWLGTSDELSEVLFSMVGAITKKLVDFGTKKLQTEKTDEIDQKAPDYLDEAEEDRETFQGANQKAYGEYCEETSECKSGVCAIDHRIDINFKVCTPGGPSDTEDNQDNQ